MGRDLHLIRFVGAVQILVITSTLTELILQSKLEVLGKGRGYVVCRQEWDGDGSFVLLFI